METIKQWLVLNMVRILSFTLSGYFLYVFHSHVGFPPEKEITTTSTTYLILFIFFLLLPLAKKLKLGKLLEYEAKVEEIKNGVKEFKEETRQMLLMQNSLINAVSNTVNQSINITLPGPGEIKEARETLDETIEDSEASESIEDEIENFLASEGSDLNFALAKLRMQLERELRRILGKRTTTEDPLNMKNQFLSARSLFKMFVNEYPKYSGMHSSFDFILKVCNAGIHGQNVPQKYAHEALYMGLKMLKELGRIPEKEF